MLIEIGIVEGLLSVLRSFQPREMNVFFFDTNRLRLLSLVVAAPSVLASGYDFEEFAPGNSTTPVDLHK